MLSRLERFSKHYENSTFHPVDISKNKEAAGEFQVFVTPALKVFSQGRELMDKNRFFSIREMKGVLDRYHGMIFM